MGVTVGLLALSLMGADGAPGPDQSQIKFQLRMLEMDGLDWRKGVYTQLQPVSRRGGITVWTAGRDVVKPLAEGASDVLMAPQVTAVAAAPVFINHHKNIAFVGQLTRIADGPKDRATALAYKPEVDGVREGFAATIAGRKLDQGVLTRLVIEETRCPAIHKVTLSEAVKKGDKGDEVKLGATLQVPETARTEVAGEWLIPNDGVLVISLGAHTVAGAEDKAVVRERLAIVEARPLADGDVVRARFSGAPVPIAPASPRPADGAPVPMPMPVPAMPSRSLPQGLAADGSAVPLPPLPDDHVTPSSLPGSSEPCASPQAPQRPEVKADPGSSRASYDKADPVKACADGGCAAKECDARSAAVQGVETKDEAPRKPESPASRPFTLRIPLNAGVTIELRASVKPLLGVGH
jgi:hypothetical protein